jgi:hypothetical protein
MLCAMEFVISALAFAVSAWTLVITSRQLMHDRSALGGRALMFLAGRSGRPELPPRFVGPGQIAQVAEYVVKVSVGGPGVFHHVAVYALGIDKDDNGDLPEPPKPRITMTAADDPIDWKFTVQSWEHAANGWAVVTWIRPYLEGVASEAVAHCLNHDRIYRWRWFHPRSQQLRLAVRNWARRHRRLSWKGLREVKLYGEWRKRERSNPIGIEGPLGCPPPCD